VGGYVMHLETNRMTLRNFTLEDLNDLHEIFSDPVVMENIEPPYDLEKSKNFLNSFCIERKPPGGFAATLKETGKVIGYVLFKSVDYPEVYEMGWIFNKDYWRKGYAFEICARLIQHGFEDMKLHRIFAEATDADKSVPLMKRLGMQQEGVQRKACKHYKRGWCDLYWYAILAEDYFRGRIREELQ
jgi:RimJ/RimL family protein N-acetyltransferase